jgi:hypothetical protein
LKNLSRLLTVVLAFALFAAVRASAGESQSFTLYIDSGTLTGNTYTGSYTWDPAVSDNLTSFTTDYPGWVDATENGATLLDSDFAWAYSDGTGLMLFFAPGPNGNPDAFSFEGGTGAYADEFDYGSTILAANAFLFNGQGTVDYGPITGTAVPEPGSFGLLATGLVGALGAIRRKRKVLPYHSAQGARS